MWSAALPSEAAQLGLDLRLLLMEAVRVATIRAQAPDARGQRGEHGAVVAGLIHPP